MKRHTVSITIPKDENGFIGRECLECKRYFKLKPGTGLPTQYCHCPYCEYEGEQKTFFTNDQLEYANSAARKIMHEKFVEPMLEKLDQSFENLGNSSRGGLFQVKITRDKTTPFFPIKYYNELELETNLICDYCKLEFAIYGIFSRCPDCNELNAFSIYKKSIEVSQKLFRSFQRYTDSDDEVQTNLKFILSNVISAFDGLGKELRKRYSDKFPENPRNLFQNLDELKRVLIKNYFLDIQRELPDYDFIRLMFQVRHIFEHNMGVVDSDFVSKIPTLGHLLGRKYILKLADIEQFLSSMQGFGDKIESEIKRHQG